MEDGRVKSHGSLSKMLAVDPVLERTIQEGPEAANKEKLDEDLDVLPLTANGPADLAATEGKLVAKEEISEGHVGLKACKRLIFCCRRRLTPCS
jgi:hypothetical protein